MTDDTQERKHTGGEWQSVKFCRLDGSELRDNWDVAVTTFKSALQSDSNELFGVIVGDDDPPIVICYTGNGPGSEANAQRIVTAVNAYEPMLEALKGLDEHWTEDLPGGPDDLPAGTILMDETLDVWRAIRKAINLAEGKEGGAGE